MAKCPFAVHKFLPENKTQPRIDPDQVILHTAVDAPGPTSLYGYFARGDVHVESHFFIRLDGTIEQYMDTERRADANYKANVRAISIETEDDGKNIAWTDEQIRSIKLLGQWLMKEHPRIARRVCPGPDKSGWGYHSMWGAPSDWTPVKGKTCPGPARIDQFWKEIAPWLNGALPEPQPKKDEEEDDDMWLIRLEGTPGHALVGGGTWKNLGQSEIESLKRAGFKVRATVNREDWDRVRKVLTEGSVVLQSLRDPYDVLVWCADAMGGNSPLHVIVRDAMKG